MRTIKILLNYCVVISCNIKLFQRNSGGVTFRGERLGPIEESWALKGRFGRGTCCRGLWTCCLRFSFLMSDWLFPCKVLITFQMKYFCYKFMVFWVSWYYERQDLQDNILYIFINFPLSANNKIVALKEIRLQEEEGAPFTAIREGNSYGRFFCTYLAMHL